MDPPTDIARGTPEEHSCSEPFEGRPVIRTPSQDPDMRKRWRPTTEGDRWLTWVESRFREIAGDHEEIDKKTFIAALNVKNSTSFFADRMFALFDRDGSRSLELAELMDGLKKLAQGTSEEKLKFLFDVYDVDGNGTIDMVELRTVLQKCMEESSLRLTDDDLDALTLALFQSADEDDNGEVSFQELLAELKRHPGVLENLTISAIQWLTPPEAGPEGRKRSKASRYCSRHYFINNRKKVIFFILYFLLNAGLFTLSAVRYRESNFCIIIARGCGMCLNFNCAFVVVLMLRGCLTWLRSTRAAEVLPLDDSIAIHKLVGAVIAVQTVIHTLAHLGNIYIVIYEPPSVNATVSLQYWEFLFTLRSGVGWIGPGFGFLSGVILDVILFIMVLCSLPFVRRTGHFQVFYWTHMLFVPFWVLLILHGPIFWYFFIVPGFVYVCEVIARSRFVKVAKYGMMYVEHVHLLPSKVTHLVVSRTDKFRFKPGDYVFVRIPAVAKYEWHPFTISSAPELKDVFWLHIRSAGHMTNKLYDYFDNKLQDIHPEVVVDRNGKQRKHSATGNKSHRGDAVGLSGVELQRYEGWSNDRSPRRVGLKERNKSGPVKIQIFIDGPYGTPSRHIFNSEHAVLIGSGIGITPFAAILQSIMFRYQTARRTCPACSHSWVQPERSKLKTNKVDFIWINRDQRCFEWFVRLLAQLELQQAAIIENPDDPFLEMQLYMTAAASRNDMKGLGLQMAMEIMHDQNKRDVITGLQTRTQAGRPNWQQVFQQIKDKNKGKVNVFFCGSSALARELRDHCSQFGFSFSKENF